MTRFCALLPFVLLAQLLQPLVGFAASDTERPNILYIMSDDHAAHAIGAYGGRLSQLDPTPNIDRLAKEGVLLRNCFCTNSICVPSRATIMTGQYSHTNGVKTLNYALEPARQTLAHEMKKAGYETAIIGKWHLKAEPAAFDYYCVQDGQGSYFNPEFRYPGKKPWPQNTFTPRSYDDVHSSDIITDQSLKWLKRRQKQRTGKPFFLMHHFKAPHDNFANAERYDWLHEGVEIPEPLSLWERGNHGPLGRPQYGTSVSSRNSRRNMGHHMHVPADMPEPNYTRESYQRYLKKYLRCVKGVDDNIGRLLAYLEETGELDNTIIIYTADQGFMLGEHDYIDKRWAYDECLRMPFVIRYPKRFAAGTVNEEMINNVDFAPTLLELAGATEMPSGFEGRSFVANLEGNSPEDWPKATYYRYWMNMTHHDNPAHYAIRTKDHKLIIFYGLALDSKGALDEVIEPYWELYDLKKDPQEMNNVVADPAYAETLVQLKKQLDELKKQVGDTDQKYPELYEAIKKAG
ncbi:MAG: sulfatase [Lacipirellulaceae bacterium]